MSNIVLVFEFRYSCVSNEQMKYISNRNLWIEIQGTLGQIIEHDVFGTSYISVERNVFIHPLYSVSDKITNIIIQYFSNLVYYSNYYCSNSLLSFLVLFQQKEYWWLQNVYMSLFLCTIWNYHFVEVKSDGLYRNSC